eukprot:scaffold122178_cov32-Tisochrysis_lutea.AAC.3
MGLKYWRNTIRGILVSRSKHRLLSLPIRCSQTGAFAVLANAASGDACLTTALITPRPQCEGATCFTAGVPVSAAIKRKATSVSRKHPSPSESPGDGWQEHQANAR